MTGHPEGLPEPPDGTEAFATAMQAIGAFMAPLLEAASGYMKQCEEAGFHPEAASTMGAQYHGLLVNVLTQNMFKRTLGGG